MEEKTIDPSELCFGTFIRHLGSTTAIARNSVVFQSTAKNLETGANGTRCRKQLPQ